MRICRILNLILLTLLVSTAGVAGAQSEIVCPPQERQYGPFDYLNSSHRARHLGAVERRHFTAKVQSLHPRGETGSLMGDVGYTLNWFPNHHGALDVLSRVAVRENNPQPLNARVHIDCRFQWARQVSPNDEMVPMLQGIYLHRLGRNADARKYLERAVEMAPVNATVRYNLGLILFQMGDYDAAREQARRAYALGFPLPGLKNMLARAGHPMAD